MSSDGETLSMKEVPRTPSPYASHKAVAFLPDDQQASYTTAQTLVVDSAFRSSGLQDETSHIVLDYDGGTTRHVGRYRHRRCAYASD